MTKVMSIFSSFRATLQIIVLTVLTIASMLGNGVFTTNNTCLFMDKTLFCVHRERLVLPNKGMAHWNTGLI